MVKLNPTLKEFLNRLIDAIDKRNSAFNSDPSKNLDAPFIISSLYRNFENYPEKFDGFVSDLENFPDYEVVIGEDSWGCTCDLFATAQITLGYSCVDEIPYYQIKFYYDQRHLGYCQCTPDMPDYREDKGCCGHNCDTILCGFYLEKVYPVQCGEWPGDEHEYWDFEDDFYEGNPRRRKEKERKERQEYIAILRKTIKADTDQLNKLLEEEEHELDEESGEGS